MNDSNTDPMDAALNQHLKALLSPPLAEGPSRETSAKTLVMLQASVAMRPSPCQYAQQFLETIIMLFRQPLFRVASIAVAFTILYFLLFSPLGASMALADVAAKLKEARTLTCTMTTSLPDGKSMVSKVYMGEPGLLRVEIGGVSVMITGDHHTLVLFPRSHTGTRIDFEGGPKNGKTPGPGDIIDGLKHLDDHDTKPVGDRIIDDIPAKGFSTFYGGMDAVVWADARTAMPLRIEATLPAKGATMVMSDFKLDVPIDDSLFSTDAPAGYTLTQTTVQAPTVHLGRVEDEVAKLIGDYAKLNGDQFPASLTDWASLTMGLEKMDEPEKTDTLGRIGGLTAKLYSLPHGFYYVGKGEKRGDKNKLIFWIKPADDANMTRGVYGDLRVADVRVEELPTTQPTP